MVAKTPSVDVAQASRQIKSDLHKTYPNTKFAVSSSRFAGGESISVRWKDGPTEGEVAKIALVYQHVRRDPRTGDELLGGNRHVGLYRDFTSARLDWAVAKAKVSDLWPDVCVRDITDAAFTILERTAFDAPKLGDVRTRSR